MALKASSEAGTAEQKRLADKKRNILVLIRQFLKDNGYVDTALQFQTEVGPAIAKFEVADNVDLGIILDDYESYFEMKFDRKPKLVRKCSNDEQLPPKGGNARGSDKKGVAKEKQKSNDSPQSRVSGDNSNNSNGKLPTLTGSSSMASDDEGVLGVQGLSVNSSELKSKKPETDDRLSER